MGPLRFELRSEDPQSPRMARLPYGPALLLLDHFVYVSFYGKRERSEPGNTQITILYTNGLIHVGEIFPSALLAQIFSYPDS